MWEPSEALKEVCGNIAALKSDLRDILDTQDTFRFSDQNDLSGDDRKNLEDEIIETRKALTHEVGRIGLSQDGYIRPVEKIIGETIIEFGDQFEVPELSEKWSDLSLDAKQDVLNSLAGILHKKTQAHAGIAFPAPQISHFSEEIKEDAHNNEALCLADPSQSPETFRLGVNLHPTCALSDEMPLCLASFAHEYLHILNTVLEHAALQGSIEEAHPLYNDANKLLYIKQNDADVEPVLCEAAYRNQVSERYAFQITEHMRAKLSEMAGTAAPATPAPGDPEPT